MSVIALEIRRLRRLVSAKANNLSHQCWLTCYARIAVKCGTLLLTAAVFHSCLLVFSAAAAAPQNEVLPKKIELAIPERTEMVVGDSRTIEVLYYSGNDKLNRESYRTVTMRRINWTTAPAGLASIDRYGRLKALKPGCLTLSAASTINSEVRDKKTIRIVAHATKTSEERKRIVSFEGQPTHTVNNLQKVVERYSQAEVMANDMVPAAVRAASCNPPGPEAVSVQQRQVTWSIVDFADGSGGRYILRTDGALRDCSRDKLQYFMGDRYLSGDGKSPVFIYDDGQSGLWVVDKTGAATHIKMVKIGYAAKAVMMSRTTKQYVSRMGLAAGARWDGAQWVPEISDNDGLWTSMYGAGEMMRYAILKRPGSGAFPEQVQEAQQSALRALKAVLLIANISGRDGTVKSRIRHLNNLRVGQGNVSSQKYLKSGAVYAVDNYVGSPGDHINFYGLDAGKTVKGRYIGGVYRFSLRPLNDTDWTQRGEAALTRRTLKGFIARTFSIPAIEHTPYDDGIFFQRSADGTQTVASQANRLYDYTASEHPILDVGDLPVPAVLQDVLKVNDVQYQASDVAYKGDTSTDELIGHLFLYKIAYDNLDQHDPTEKVLKDLIRTTVKNLAQHLLDNGYTLVDATGQGTRWGKTSRDYFNSDFAIEDNSLNSLVLLNSFKLAYYVSGEQKWLDEYQWLLNGRSFNYARLVSAYWRHWMYLVENEDCSPEDRIYRLKPELHPSMAEKTRHALYCLNHSDEEMAMLAYYLLFQMESDETILKQFRIGLDGWWHSISFSENPLWYYIYQLAYPQKRQWDAYGHDLLATAAWSLSRHPIDTRTYKAFFTGSRADVLDDGGNSINPNVPVGWRTSAGDTKRADNPTNSKLFPAYDPARIYRLVALPPDERALHKFNGTTFTDIDRSDNSYMEAATTYTLPYWFGRYHHMLRP